TAAHSSKTQRSASGIDTGNRQQVDASHGDQKFTSKNFVLGNGKTGKVNFGFSRGRNGNSQFPPDLKAIFIKDNISETCLPTGNVQLGKIIGCYLHITYRKRFVDTEIFDTDGYRFDHR